MGSCTLELKKRVLYLSNWIASKSFHETSLSVCWVYGTKLYKVIVGSHKFWNRICRSCRPTFLVNHDLAEDNVEESPPPVGHAVGLDVNVSSLHRLRTVKVKPWKMNRNCLCYAFEKQFLMSKYNYLNLRP